jgi:hypothetical protein
MGVTFWGNFASRTLLVPFHWRGMCYAHQFSREGSLCVREAEETALVGPSQAQFQRHLLRLLCGRCLATGLIVSVEGEQH